MVVDKAMAGVLLLRSLSALLLWKALRKSGFGMDFKGVLSSQRVVFMANAFIDDTNLIKTVKFAQDDFHEVLL